MQISMLYYITEDIIEAAEKENSKVIEVLEYIAMAHRHGKHIVTSNRKILQRLIEIKCYENSKTVEIYKSILNKYATFGNIIRKITLKVVFVLNKNPYIKKNSLGRYEEIGYPIEHVTINNLINETALLVENINEVAFYFQMGELYKKKQGFEINCSYSVIHGGGDTTKNVLKHEAKTKTRFCLAFLDSDKLCPDDSLGSTLKGVKLSREINECFYTSDYIYSDKVREVENLIPIDILRKVCEGCTDLMKGVEDIKCIQNKNEDIYYYDVKSGISEQKYCNITKCNQKEYITKHIMITRNVTREELKDIVNPSKEKKMLYGTGNEILKNVISFLEKEPVLTLENAVFTPHLEEEWMRFGKEIVNWTCASFPMRV